LSLVIQFYSWYTPFSIDCPGLDSYRSIQLFGFIFRRIAASSNNDHHHSGIGIVTPADMHYGLAENVVEERKSVLRAAFEAHPERFVKGVSLPPVLPKAAWINPPVNILVNKSNLQ